MTAKIVWLIWMFIPVDSIQAVGHACDMHSLRVLHGKAAEAVGIGGFREDVLALALIDYYIAGCGMAEGMENEWIRYHIDEALNVLQDFDSEGDDADVQALISILAGMRVSLTSFPKLLNYTKLLNGALKRGKEADSTNPRIWLAEAINKFHTPKEFGGGPGKAKMSLERSIRLFNTHSDTTYLKNWGYEIALLYNAKIYAELGDTASAIKEAEKALKLFPNYGRLKAFYKNLKAKTTDKSE